MSFRRRATGVGPAKLAIIAMLALGLLASACGPPRRSVTGWVPYWTTDTGRTTVDTAADLLSEISPFWYRATSATTLANDELGSDQAAVVAQAKAANIPLLPSVRDGMAAGAMAAVLADPAQRAAHIATLVNLVEANGFAGIDLDYEQFAFADGTASWASTRPVWVQFVVELGAALHARARLLAVTTPPIYSSTRAPGTGYWVYDWAAIAPHIDRLRIMAYDYSFSSPGPIAPLWWVRQIVSYAVSAVPPAKIQIGAPTYGRDFITGITGTCPVGVSPARADVRNSRTATLIQQKGATPVRDGPSGEMTFSYVDTFTGPPPPPTTVPPPAQVTCQVARTVWYPDIESLMSKARLVGEFGLSGLAQWALGFEDLAQWQPVRDYAATLPHPGGTDPTGAVEVVQPGTGMLIVGGWAFDPETDLPVQVAVTTAGGRTVVLANGARPDVAQAYPGAGPIPRLRLPDRRASRPSDRLPGMRSASAPAAAPLGSGAPP